MKMNKVNKWNNEMKENDINNDNEIMINVIMKIIIIIMCEYEM